jgi:rod shape-determining protein MreC
VLAVTLPIRNFFATVFTLKDVIHENALLSDRLRNLEESQVQLESVKHENELLKKELGFVDESKLGTIPCSVISYDTEGITDSFVINCGKERGVKEGMAVVGTSRVIGKVTFVGTSTSTGEFITRPGSSIDAKVSRSNSLGIVKGSYGSGLTFEGLSQTSDVQKEDLVVTAGVNSLIPAGLIIGEVQEIISKDNELFKRTTLTTPINFRSLKYVFVITN